MCSSVQSNPTGETQSPQHLVQHLHGTLHLCLSVRGGVPPLRWRLGESTARPLALAPAASRLLLLALTRLLLGGVTPGGWRNKHLWVSCDDGPLSIQLGVLISVGGWTASGDVATTLLGGGSGLDAGLQPKVVDGLALLVADWGLLDVHKHEIAMVD